MDALSQLVDVLSRHMPRDGMQPSAIAGVTLIRSGTPTQPMPVVYEPTLCLIAQGRKQVMLGATAYVYDAARYLVASVDMPVTGSVIEATEARPYLCLQLDLDMAQLSELALQYAGGDPAADGAPTGIALDDTRPELLEAVLRLARLLDTPRDIAALAPLVRREILYRLLTGAGAGSAMVRQMARADSRLSQISRAIAWLRRNYDAAFRIDDLAEVAGMSRSTFHAHFKTVTSMTPLEFRSRLRLQEARRLMVAQALDAADAGFRVGYESPSQFSRDYVRMFGLPPAKDAVQLRRAGALAG